MFNNRNQENKIFKILFCFFANFICFGICYYCRLPMRMEHIGSLYASAVIGIGPAIFIAVCSQLLYSLFYFGIPNAMMLLPVIAVLLMTMLSERFGWLNNIISSLGAMTVAGFVNALLTIPISLWIGRGFLSQTCWITIYDSLGKSLQYHPLTASLIAILPYCFLNLFCTWTAAMIAYRLTPKHSDTGYYDSLAKKRQQNRK